MDPSYELTQNLSSVLVSTLVRLQLFQTNCMATCPCGFILSAMVFCTLSVNLLTVATRCPIGLLILPVCTPTIPMIYSSGSSVAML